MFLTPKLGDCFSDDNGKMIINNCSLGHFRGEGVKYGREGIRGTGSQTLVWTIIQEYVF